jgi:hypothetical protein
MRICNLPQNTPLHSPFMIILHWNPNLFHDHLALDNSARAEMLNYYQRMGAQRLRRD